MMMQKQQKEQVQNQLRGFLTEIDNEFMELKGGTFAYLETGEFFTKTEHDKYIQKKLEKYKVDMFATVNQTVFNEKGIDNEQSMTVKTKSKKKRTNMRERYEGGNFNIVYTNRLEDIEDMKLNNNEKLVFYVLRDYIQFPTNCIVIKSEIPSMKDLEPLVGLTERSIITVMKSLEEKGLIKRVQFGHKKAVYVNPEYYASGKDLEIETLKLFGLVECDDEKIDQYI
jgi:hypothetical protein